MITSSKDLVDQNRYKQDLELVDRGITATLLRSYSKNTPNIKMTRSKKEPEFSIVHVEVINPRIHNCSRGRFVDYEIQIDTNNIAFSRKNSSVRRRYSDFIWLRNKLCTTEINGFASEFVVPNLPPKRLFGRFEPKFVHSRMQGLKDFLHKVLNRRKYLSFVGLHLFLQTELSVQKIEDYINGNFKENYTVEELVNLSESSQIEKALDSCTLKTCYNVVLSDFDAFVMVDCPQGDMEDVKSFHSASIASADSNTSINNSPTDNQECSACIYTSIK
ncbi:sorting nexin-10-like [Actinia tenebrosa]|uniref:Sorting nexin-10-like n=1 Tax=Actinia tenebrosa TaxID=6105 RepID=A0A6P8H3Y6_ACTTE|nr:sorting nexin-10-like [Actinia tenebrosa]